MKFNLDESLQRVQKPARYIGGELGAVYKDKKDISVRFAFCFPDIYEIGMSHLGMKILYDILNRLPFCWCERVFAPWPDFEEELIRMELPLYALESYDPLYEFDLIGFSLQYELSYTSILQMLHLGKVPILKKDRKELRHLVVAGGPCVCNPEPLCDFVDVFLLGEGEEQLPAFVTLYAKAKREGYTKEQFLKEAVSIDGVYVPSFYEVTYRQDGCVDAICPEAGVPEKVGKAIVSDMNEVLYPKQFVVPYIQIVHDRSVIELMRGCIRGCRFCQAGFIYRPLREKSCALLEKQMRLLTEHTGYEELSLSSLSTSDYSELEQLLSCSFDYTDQHRIHLSLSSMRADNFSNEIMDKVAAVRKQSLTFAAEAATQRLRDVINKNLNEEEILRTCKLAFEGGYSTIKLYFMIGLPTETLEDVQAIPALAEKILDLYKEADPEKRSKKKPEISISVATFVPKPWTPFQWEGQDYEKQILQKQETMLQHTRRKAIRLKWHDVHTSALEAALARGDRRLGKVIYRAFKKGCRLDSWEEWFAYKKWQEAFAEENLSIEFYANRRRNEDEVFPWSHLDYGIDPGFLLRENQNAQKQKTTPNCRQSCSNCGIRSLTPCRISSSGSVKASKQSMASTFEKVDQDPCMEARIFFKKKGGIRWISHLDMIRCMQRALKRSGLPIWYTQGFHPHPYITFALPLSLGFESEYEIMDFRLVKEVDFSTVQTRLSDVLPEGLTLLKAASPVFTSDQIRFAEYEIQFCTKAGAKLKTVLLSFLQQDCILAEKKTKKGWKTINLKPDIQSLTCEENLDGLLWKCRLPAGQKMINPQLVLRALFTDDSKDIKAETGQVKIKRTLLLLEDNRPFT